MFYTFKEVEYTHQIPRNQVVGRLHWHPHMSSNRHTLTSTLSLSTPLQDLILMSLGHSPDPQDEF
ncbi:hypothetical protein GBAR_LOCUS24479 [Geodia barretti]|uniref:Uncharacterized protein n=1 Tax=Geodia barretti TaxID=519541 RepID=A0AA35XAB2_GEOBA|nr:hypothetical protein GBAR_LOCUS24479 [Geodia barretti]